MDVKLALSQMIGQQANTLNELSEKDLVYKQKLCMEILGVANVISPGNIKKFFCFLMLVCLTLKSSEFEILGTATFATSFLA